MVFLPAGEVVPAHCGMDSSGCLAAGPVSASAEAVKWAVRKDKAYTDLLD